MHKMAAFFISVMVCLSISAQTMLDARAAMNRKDYASAAQTLRKLAEDGDAGAQLEFGLLHIRGQGVPQDAPLGVDWIRKSAEQNLPVAQGDMGFLYRDGTGVQKDPVEAARWFHLAAAQDHADSQLNLGYMYLSGIGVAKDEGLAAEYARKAANKGQPNGEYLYGWLLSKGTGVQMDIPQGLLWMHKAADHGEPQAKEALVKFRSYTLAAPFWTRKESMEQGGLETAERWVRLGKFNQAVNQFLELYEMGNSEAANNLAQMYKLGQGVPASSEQESIWLQKARELKVAAQAKAQLAEMHRAETAEVTARAEAEAERQAQLQPTQPQSDNSATLNLLGAILSGVASYKAEAKKPAPPVERVEAPRQLDGLSLHGPGPLCHYEPVYREGVRVQNLVCY